MRTFTSQEVGRGVSAAIAEPDGVAVGNAAHVELDDGVLVFDCTLSLTAGRELRAAAEARRRIGTIVYSHWHGDHVNGANAMPAEALVVATMGTAMLLEERMVERLRELKATVDEITEGPFATIARTEIPQLEVIFPDETFTDERDFGRARAITYGGGHTGSDAFLWLEDERLLLAGDLVVVGSHPWVGDGDVRTWRLILERIAELDPKTIVPGHGPVAGPEALEFVDGYLETLERTEPGAPIPANYSSLEMPSVWERNLAARSGVNS